jgi:hypothetical protein
MVLTVADIERWSAGAVRDVFHVATARGNATLDASRQLSTLAVFDTWEGATAEARKHTNASIRQDLDAHGNESLAVAQAAGKAANDIEHVQSELRTLRADATALHMTIDAVSNKIVPAEKMPPMEAEIAEMQLQPRLDKILTEANAVDAELAAAINMADGDAPAPAGPPSPPVGKPGGSPAGPPGAPPPQRPNDQAGGGGAAGAGQGRPDPTNPRYTRSPLTDPIVAADPSVVARQAGKVAEARRALDAAQARLDAAAKQAYTQGPGSGPGRDVTDPLSQAVFDARRTLTEQSAILDNLNKSAAATGAARPIPTPPLPPNAGVQAFPPEPSVASQAARGLSDASHDISQATFGVVPDVAKDVRTFGNWGEAGSGERTDAILDSASLIPGGKLFGLAHHGLGGLVDAVRHGDDIPTPHLDAPTPHTDVPPPVEHHVDAPPPGAGHGDGLTHTSAESGGPGAWNQELNHPAPLTHYTVDDRFNYTTDANGRVNHAEMNYDSTHEPGGRNTYQQRIAGGDDRLPGDHGGHIFGTQFGGPGEGINITAMRDTLNAVGQRDYYNLEQQWRAYADAGSQVQVKVDIAHPEGSLRPETYSVETYVDGQLKSTYHFDN